MKMPVRAEELQITLGNNNILKGVTIRAKEGSFLGIIGPNGSGKSTLLRCIYRTLKPDSGCVFLDDDPLLTLRPKESAKRLAVVAQHNYYNFDFSVLEVVMMGRAPHKKAMERDNKEDYAIANDALKTVGMADFSNRSFSTLSGGEQQRVILARALAQQTKILVLDEPTNHLDITHQLQLMRIVRELPVTVISAIHDLNIAAAFCDYLYVMQNGLIVGEGTPAEILTEEFLQKIYQVRTEIVRDRKGQMHILFLE